MVGVSNLVSYKYNCVFQDLVGAGDSKIQAVISDRDRLESIRFSGRTDSQVSIRFDSHRYVILDSMNFIFIHIHAYIYIDIHVRTYIYLTWAQAGPGPRAQGPEPLRGAGRAAALGDTCVCSHVHVCRVYRVYTFSTF